MTMFSKKGIDTVDYTLLQKKGLIKKKEIKESQYKVNSQGMIDLTAQTQNAVNSEIAQTTNSEQSTDPFSFMDNMAQANNSGLTTQSSELNENNTEVNAMKIKMDDLEYKLTQLMDKLSLIESKMNDFERKVVG